LPLVFARLVMLNHKVVGASRHVTAPNTGRLVQKELAIAGGCLGILIDGDDDRLHIADSASLLARRDDEFVRAAFRNGVGLLSSSSHLIDCTRTGSERQRK
jgi:hypothetical protein